MKAETKVLINWAKEHIASYRAKLVKNKVPNVNTNIEKSMCDYFVSFLNSLPEIESHLCRGGYIQDLKKESCCEGTYIRFCIREYFPETANIKQTVGFGRLNWDEQYGRFVATPCSKETSIPLSEISWFEKVKE